MRDVDFRENWDAALERMTRADPWVLDKAWFTLNWFLANDENWQKCRDGNYDAKAGGGHPPAKPRVGRNYHEMTQEEMDLLNAEAAAELAEKEASNASDQGSG